MNVSVVPCCRLSQAGQWLIRLRRRDGRVFANFFVYSCKCFFYLFSFICLTDVCRMYSIICDYWLTSELKVFCASRSLCVSCFLFLFMFDIICLSFCLLSLFVCLSVYSRRMDELYAFSIQSSPNIEASEEGSRFHCSMLSCDLVV